MAKERTRIAEKEEKQPEKVTIDLNKPYENMTVEELQEVESEPIQEFTTDVDGDAVQGTLF